MKKVLFIVSFLMFSCNVKIKTIDVFVSESAISNYDGTKEHPFLTIEDAIIKANEIKQNEPEANIVIHVLKGDYNLSKAIVISESLSGLTIKGSKASEVSIKGSIPLNLKWSKYNTDIFVSDVDENLDFDQLIVNGQPQILARYPNYDEGAQYWQGYAEDAISKERVASWEHPEGTFFHALHKGKWGGFHFRITGISEDGSPILEGGHQNNRGSRPHEKFRMVENVFEELDSPSEWYLDKRNNKLYYWPTKGVVLEKSKIEVSVLKDLIQVIGTLENPVRNVTIRNIKFENTKRTFMEDFEPLLRSDWTIYRGGVILFEGTENCNLEDNEFTNLGGNVIMVSRYNKNLEITGNHIRNCGASGVSFVGDASAVRSPSFNYGKYVPIVEMDTVSGPKNALYPRECLVKDNLIYRIGRTEKQTAGVQISMAMDITVSHNSIYDVPRAGINIGDGTWGGHILEYNDVFNTVLETSDHGSFNSWGRDRFWHPKRNIMDSLTTANPKMSQWDAIKTTIIRNNRFRCDHGWDIDLDDGSSNYHIYNNLLLNNGLKLREGFNRVAENNIIVNNSLHPHVWFEKSEDVFKYNIVASAYRDIRLLGWGKEFDYNFFSTEISLMTSQMHNRDANSAFGDPMFKNPTRLDFSVAENSPALKIGFKNFPMDQFGVKNEALKAIAKTPEIPVLRKISEKNKNGASTVTWLRNKIKDVDSEQEQSAYGLNTAEGVIVLTTWKDSPAVKGDGLKKGDVILKAGGATIKNIKDFFKANLNHNKSDKLDLVIMRDQSEKEIVIKIK